MKKSLVALAALTLVGAASAQVTITGNISFSQQSGLDGTRGLAMTDNSIFLGITEDLGGGNKLTASSGFDAGGRGGPTSPGGFGAENANLKVSGNWGSVNIASYESDGPLANIEGLSGASLDNGMFDSNAVGLGKRFRSAVTYATPEMSGFTGALTYVAMNGNFTSADPMDARTKVVPALTYQAGPLKAYIEDAFFNGSYPGTTNGTTNNSITQPTIYATYDFGVAKVGAGWTKQSNGDAQTIFGVNVPVGALTLGLASASWMNSAAAGTATWTEASVAYSLSKRTSLKASFGTVNDAAVGYAQATAASQTNATNSYGLQGANYSTANESQTRVGIFHSF